MLAAHFSGKNPPGKRLGLPHSHFQKSQLSDSTVYVARPPKNRHFSSSVAKDGLRWLQAGLKSEGGVILRDCTECRRRAIEPAVFGFRLRTSFGLRISVFGFLSCRTHPTANRA